MSAVCMSAVCMSAVCMSGMHVMRVGVHVTWAWACMGRGLSLGRGVYGQGPVWAWVCMLGSAYLSPVPAGISRYCASTSTPPHSRLARQPASVYVHQSCSVCAPIYPPTDPRTTHAPTCPPNPSSVARRWWAGARSARRRRCSPKASTPKAWTGDSKAATVLLQLGGGRAAPSRHRRAVRPCPPSSGPLPLLSMLFIRHGGLGRGEGNIYFRRRHISATALLRCLKCLFRNGSLSFTQALNSSVCGGLGAGVRAAFGDG